MISIGVPMTLVLSPPLTGLAPASLSAPDLGCFSGLVESIRGSSVYLSSSFCILILSDDNFVKITIKYNYMLFLKYYIVNSKPNILEFYLKPNFVNLSYSDPESS